jgi:class 3 adenylate cyclase/tetratricopeptide (TPR) repeat protein
MRAHHATNPGDGVSDETPPVANAEAAVAGAQKLLGLGEPLLAYNTLEKALELHPDHLRLRQLKGLALARSGALQRANELLAGLRDEGHDDGETLGLLARTHKDLALLVEDAGERESHLAAAFGIYSAGYRKSERRGAIADAYYTGINAATVALLSGRANVARDIAAGVEELCRTRLPDCETSYWSQATLAEAALIQGDIESAERRYAAAARLAGRCYGNLSSTRRQARLLLDCLGESDAWLDEAIRVPPVLVYTGHMIDAPGRAQPRFEPHMEDRVRADIRARLEPLGPAASYGSAACGADILCLECMRDLGGEINIVLPFPVDEFRQTSVDLRDDGDWGKRFERLLDDANEVLVVSQKPPAGETTTYEYANLIMTGLARLRAQMLDTSLQALAVWDGQGTGEPGGTASVVSMWQASGMPLERVILDSVDAARPARVTAAPARHKSSGDQPRWLYCYSVETMLFADAVGFSRLTEDQVPLFYEHYVEPIAEFNAACGCSAVHIETAGDGMYMVFDDPCEAGLYALGLSELVNSRDWESVGLPADLGIRVGLHCGPVYVGADPITGRPLYTGVHTSRTARIEPITPPGQVYASSAFAAVATARNVRGLRFSYIGRTRLAKHYGVLPLYHVKRERRGSRGQ